MILMTIEKEKATSSTTIFKSVMADNGSLRSPNLSYKQLTSSFFSTPRLFSGFVSKGSSETESVMGSPTSVLDTKPFSAPKNPFHSDDPTTPKIAKPEIKNLWEKLDSKGLLDALTDEKSDVNLSQPYRRMVLFGSQLKIQVPPCDFGIKTRISHVGPFSPGSVSPSLRKSMFESTNCGAYSCLSASEMELSEDYTRVISYGPNPKTKHIFDDCIVGSSCGVVKLSESRKENGPYMNRAMSYPSDYFLSFCYACKKQLGQGKDIYMYRGEKAFCSSECRYKEMMLEEDHDLEISSLDDL